MAESFDAHVGTPHRRSTLDALGLALSVVLSVCWSAGCVRVGFDETAADAPTSHDDSGTLDSLGGEDTGAHDAHATDGPPASDDGSVEDAGAIGDAGPVGDAGSVGDAGAEFGRALGAVALYLFDETSGDVLFDRSSVPPALDLLGTPGTFARKPGGIRLIGARTSIVSREPATKLVEACKQSGEMSVEVWAAPSHELGEGEPIVALSTDANDANTVMEYGSDGLSGRFHQRVRTTDTTASGEPSLASGPISGLGLTHLLFTHDQDGHEAFYIDGVHVDVGTRWGGFGAWDFDEHLVIANEALGGRPWLGEFHMIAVYARALTPAEATANLRAGPNPELFGRQAMRTPGEELLYDFSEGTGDIVHDTGSGGWAFDLTITDASSVVWLPGALRVETETRIMDGQSASIPSAFVDRFVATNAISLEAWVRPRFALQGGPARIVALTRDTSNHLFMLGHGLNTGESSRSFLVRLRTAGTDLSGEPPVGTSTLAVHAPMTHVVFTHDAAGTESFYVNGAQSPPSARPGGFGNWVETPLTLGHVVNGLGAPFLGDIHLVAIYDRSLSLDEVLQNLAVGPDPELE